MARQIQLRRGTSIENDNFVPTGSNNRLYMPVSKGNVIHISWNATLSSIDFKFIYANGAY